MMIGFLIGLLSPQIKLILRTASLQTKCTMSYANNYLLCLYYALCIVLSTGDTIANNNRKDMILAFMVYSLRKNFMYYRLDASPVSVKETLSAMG